MQSGSCLLLFNLVFCHTLPSSLLQPHWPCWSLNRWEFFLPQGLYTFTSFCLFHSFLRYLHGFLFIIQVSVQTSPLQIGIPWVCLELPPHAPILSLSENYTIYLLTYLFILSVDCFPLENKSIKSVRTLLSLDSSFCFSTLHYKIPSFPSPLWFLLITFFIPIFLYLLITSISPM